MVNYNDYSHLQSTCNLKTQGESGEWAYILYNYIITIIMYICIGGTDTYTTISST
jgi:hypothetical protein